MKRWWKAGDKKESDKDTEDSVLWDKNVVPRPCSPQSLHWGEKTQHLIDQYLAEATDRAMASADQKQDPSDEAGQECLQTALLT